jgi:hypothetical protein
MSPSSRAVIKYNIIDLRRQKFPLWGLGGSFPELPNLMYVQAAILAPSSIRFQGHWYPISKLV